MQKRKNSNQQTTAEKPKSKFYHSLCLSATFQKCLKRLFIIGGALVGTGIVLIVIIDLLIGFSVHDKIYTNINELPYRPYGLVLGTSRYYSNNSLNLFYYNRILAAQQAISHHKVDYLLLSGDNRTRYYNEPRMMQRDLIRLGVNPELIYLDYAGFRTLDSVVRAKKVFKLNSITIISQQFHCERALFIANHYNIDAICYAADYPQGHEWVRIREFFARVMALWDIMIDRQPYFLGKPEPLPLPIPVIEKTQTPTSTIQEIAAPKMPLPASHDKE